jgi:hypothetical protein
MLNESKPRRKITRRKPGTKPTGDYFSKETQKAILDYQNSPSIPEKQQIYVEKILPAFDSLVENLINVYGFKVMYETKRDLKTECMEFLFTTVEKFDGEKGSKAFSYFNVVAKNWLTIKSKQNAKKVKTYISTDYKESFTNADIEQLESFNIVPSYEDIMTSSENTKNLKKIVDGLEKKVKTENEILCIKAIQEIVENLEDIDILNKRAVLLYIREITNLSSKQLSVVLSNLKKYYKDVKKDINNE